MAAKLTDLSNSGIVLNLLAPEFLRACHTIQDMGAQNELHTINS